MRKRDSRPQYPVESGRGGMGLGMSVQAGQIGQMGGSPQQAHTRMNLAMAPSSMPLPDGAGPSAYPRLRHPKSKRTSLKCSLSKNGTFFRQSQKPGTLFGGFLVFIIG